MLKEKRIIFTLISTILLCGGYSLFVYNRYLVDQPELLNDLHFWGLRMVYFVPLAIAAMIILHIIFAIAAKVIADEELDTESDEMDKLIELKSMKISQWIFSVGLVLAMGSQALGMDTWVMMVTLVGSGLLTGLVEAAAQIYFYRKGI